MNEEKPKDTMANETDDSGRDPAGKRNFFDKIPIADIVIKLSFIAIILAFLLLLLNLLTYVWQTKAFDGLRILKMVFESLATIVPLFLAWGIGQIIKIIQAKNEK